MSAAAERPKRRMLLGCLVTLVVILVLAGAALAIFAGSIQRSIVESVVSGLLDADTAVAQAHLYPSLALEDLVIRQPGLPEGEPAAITAQQVAASYTLFPEDGRHVDSFTAEQLRLSLFRDAEGNRNFAFIRDFLSAPASEDPLAFLPRSISLLPLEIHAAAPDWELLLGGLSVTGKLPAESQVDLRVQAEPVAGHWRLQDVTDDRPLQGNIDLKVTRNGADAAFDGRVQLDDLASIDAKVQAKLGATETAFDVELREARLTQAIWGRLLRDMAEVPLAFETLDISSGDLKGIVSESAIKEATVSLAASATGVVVGEADAPIYQGDASVELQGELGGEASALSAALSVDPGGTLDVTATGDVENLSATIETGVWQIDAMRAALPEELRGTLDAWPALSALKANGEVQRVGSEFSGTLSLAPTLRDGAGKAPTVETVWQLTLEDEAPADSAFDVMVKATGAGTARLEATGSGGTPSRLQLHFEQTPVATWYKVWKGEDFGSIDATLSGDINGGTYAEGILPLDLSLKGDVEGLAEKALAMSITGSARLDTTASVARSVNAELDLGDLGRLTLKNAELAQEPASAKGALNTDLDLDYLGAALGMPDLHGVLVANATLGWDGNKILLANLKATGETLGYGDFFLPYGTESVATGTLSYNPDEARIAIAPFDLVLMEGTEIHAGRVATSLGDNSKTSADTVTLTTDLQLLVAREFLAGADALLEATLTEVQLDDDRIQAQVVAALDGSSLILPNTLSTLRDVKANLNFAYDNGMDGGGTVSLGELEVAGTILRSLSSEVICKGNEITLKGLKSSLFAGDLVATIVANLGSSDLAATIEASGEQIDLAVFTEEFEPPEVELTGKVHGTVTASLTPAGVTAMAVDLESTEGFSLNREVVEDLLKSQQGSGMSDRVMNKVMNKMLGEEPQRPFDRAALTLNLQEDGRIGGEARLESSDLNLTVAIAADPEAILAALRARQEEG